MRFQPPGPDVSRRGGAAWIACAALLLLLVVKLRFLLRGDTITGWDTPGHLQMADTYARLLFGSFDSLGHDASWFGGYPAFYFYPPLIYFGMAHLQLLGLTVDAAYGIATFVGIALTGYAYVRWTELLLRGESRWVRGALAFSAAAFFLAFPGDGHQGVSIAGALGGTVAGTYAHGIAILALHRLELCRRDRSAGDRAIFVLLAGLLFYTHLLTCVFFFCLLGLYWLLTWREFGGLRELITLSLAPVALGLPIILLYLRYSHFSHMEAIHEPVPGILAIVGFDAWLRIKSGGSLLTELVRWFKWVPLGMLALFGAGLLRALSSGERRPGRLFVLLGALGAYVVTQDPTANWALGGPGVHWYRAYGLFFGLFSVFAVLSLHDALRTVSGSAQRAIAAAFALGAAGALLVYDFEDAAGIPSFALEENEPAEHTAALQSLLAGLPPSSLILTEPVKGAELYGSPHSLDHFVHRAGHRSALGLTVQASLTARLHYAYLGRGLPHLFQFGHGDLWSRVLHSHIEGEAAVLDAAFLDYLRRAGIHYVLGRTETMQRWLGAQPDAFTPVGSAGGVFLYQLHGAAPPAEWRRELPLGFVSLGTLNGQPPELRKQVSRFLVESNQARLRLGAAPPILNLDPDWQSVRGSLHEVVSGLIVFHTGPGLPDPAPLRGLGVPIYAFNFAPEGASEGLQVYSTRRPAPHRPVPSPPQGGGPAALTMSGRSSTVDGPAQARCTPTVVRQSFFADWSGNAHLFQTDMNQLYACAPGGHLELTHSNPLSRVITLAMYLALLSLAGLLVVTQRRSASSGPIRRTSTAPRSNRSTPAASE